MQIFSTFVITALTLAGFSAARSCTTGLNYCGSTLFGIGNYNDIIGQSLIDSRAGSNPNDALFSCLGPWATGTGLLGFIRDCGPGRCIDGGSGHADFCAPSLGGVSGSA